MLAIRQRDVCALDPSRDSATCPDASIYRYQSGCHGKACRLKQHNAYERRKNGKAPEVVKVVRPKKKAAATKTANPKAAPATKRPNPKAPPTKRTPAKKAPATTKTVARRRISKAPTKSVSAA